jgi:NADH-quinone oxidoreductase subunit B
MELSEPAIDTPRPSVPLRNRKTLADDPFSPYQSRGIRQGFLVASADNLIAWARTGSLMWMQFGLPAAPLTKVSVV